LQLAKRLEARLIQRRVTPAGRRFRATHGQALVLERQVLPLQCLDLTCAQTAEEIDAGCHVRVDPTWCPSQWRAPLRAPPCIPRNITRVFSGTGKSGEVQYRLARNCPSSRTDWRRANVMEKLARIATNTRHVASVRPRSQQVTPPQRLAAPFIPDMCCRTPVKMMRCPAA
jgi:hypothetical protein